MSGCRIYCLRCFKSSLTLGCLFGQVLSWIEHCRLTTASVAKSRYRKTPRLEITFYSRLCVRMWAGALERSKDPSSLFEGEATRGERYRKSCTRTGCVFTLRCVYVVTAVATAVSVKSIYPRSGGTIHNVFDARHLSLSRTCCESTSEILQLLRSLLRTYFSLLRRNLLVCRLTRFVIWLNLS